MSPSWYVRERYAPWLGSAAVHLLVLTLLAWFSTRAPAPPTRTWVELDLTTAKPRASLTPDSQRVVQTETVPQAQQVPAEIAAPTRAWGEREQRVERESVSRERLVRMGNTAPGARVASKPHAAHPLRQLAPRVLPLASDASGERALDRTADDFAAMGGGGEGVPQDYVRGVRESERTLLSTREFVYFGYFQRIRASLDRAWARQLRDRLERLYRGGRQLASDTEHQTRVLVYLDGQGRIARVQVLEDSGSRELDEAAVAAFNEAGPFPNPPAGLLERSELIPIRWDFVLRS